MRNSWRRVKGKDATTEDEIDLNDLKYIMLCWRRIFWMSLVDIQLPWMSKEMLWRKNNQHCWGSKHTQYKIVHCRGKLCTSLQRDCCLWYTCSCSHYSTWPIGVTWGYPVVVCMPCLPWSMVLPNVRNWVMSAWKQGSYAAQSTDKWFTLSTMI